MTAQDAVVWLLAAQLAIDLAVLALLGFAVWKARTLRKTLAGINWKIDKFADIFVSAVASIDLTARAAAASTVAIQTIARDLRPLAHADEPPDSFTNLVQPGA